MTDWKGLWRNAGDDLVGRLSWKQKTVEDRKAKSEIDRKEEHSGKPLIARQEVDLLQ